VKVLQNWFTFADVMIKSQVYCFFEPQLMSVWFSIFIATTYDITKTINSNI